MSVPLRFFLTEDQDRQVVEKIRTAEKKTSGEIRIHIENYHGGKPAQRAVILFKELNMHKTKLRNGVLFYIAVKDRNVTILGDKGINRRVPDNFWGDIKDTVIEHFKADEFFEGICHAVKESGNQLRKFFPYERDDVDELKNDISYNNN